MTGNRLLDALGERTRTQLIKVGRSVVLRQYKVLYREGERPSRVYFLQTGLASVVVDMPEGKQVEVGLIGTNGMIGLPFILGRLPSANRCFLQMDSSGLSVPLEAFQSLMHSDPELRFRVLEFLQSYLFTTQRIAACARVHTASQRLATWLLQAHLLSGSCQFSFTHELLALMTAVQRTTVSSIMNRFESEGLLQHGWGTVTLQDLSGLQKHACSCFDAIRLAYQLPMNPVSPCAF